MDIAGREQIGDGHAEGLGDLLSRRQRNVPLRPFNRPDKRPIQSGVQCQRLLRPAVRHAQQPDVPGQLPG